MKQFSQAVFASHEQFPAGLQALEILASVGKRVEPLAGEMAISSPGAVVLFPCPNDTFHGKYLRIIPSVVTERLCDLKRMSHAQQLSWTQQAGVLIAINMRRASKTGLFEGPHLIGFRTALHHLSGYTELSEEERQARRRLKRKRYLENRQSRSLMYEC